MRVKWILCSFSLVIEEKSHKEIPELSRLEVLEKISTKNLCLDKCKRQHIRPIKLRRFVRFFVQSEKFYCFININRLDSFKKSFTTITSLSELPFSLSFYHVNTNERSDFYEMQEQHRQLKTKYKWQLIWQRTGLHQSCITLSDLSRKSEHLSKVAWDWLKITTNFNSFINS